jgi:hypothetical protein
MKCSKNGNSGAPYGESRQRLESLARFATAITTTALVWLVWGFSLAYSALELLLSGLVALGVTLALSLGIWAYRHYWV